MVSHTQMSGLLLHTGLLLWDGWPSPHLWPEGKTSPRAKLQENERTLPSSDWSVLPPSTKSADQTVCVWLGVTVLAEEVSGAGLSCARSVLELLLLSCCRAKPNESGLHWAHKAGLVQGCTLALANKSCTVSPLCKWKETQFSAASIFLCS